MNLSRLADSALVRLRQRLRAVGILRPLSGQRSYDRVLEALGPGDIAIDGGAYIGKVSEVMGARGATVYAFEPNPVAFRALERRFRRWPNVHCMNNAISTTAGSMLLYMHENAHQDPLAWGQGSSGLTSKPNIDVDNAVEVGTVSFIEFLDSLPNEYVTVIKLDIEGMEVDVVEALMESGWHSFVGEIFIERHDHKILELREPMARLLANVANMGVRNIHFDWH